MFDIDSETRLADVVTNHPPLARELERLGLDYWRSGDQPLSEACEAVGLETLSVVRRLRDRALDASADPPAWSQMGAAQLVDHIEAVHHRYLWDQLPKVSGLVEQVVADRADRYPELHGVAATFAELRHAVERHLQCEEMELFPVVREIAATTSVAAPLRSGVDEMFDEMLHQHDRTGLLIVTLRELTDGFRPPGGAWDSHWNLYDALARLVADTGIHVHLENNLLLPAVASMRRRHLACR